MAAGGSDGSSPASSEIELDPAWAKSHAYDPAAAQSPLPAVGGKASPGAAAALRMPSAGNPTYGTGSSWAGLGGLGFKASAPEPRWTKPPRKGDLTAVVENPDASRNIIRYRHERLANCGALALFDGTIFSDRFIWLQGVLYCAWGGVGFALGWLYMAHGPEGSGGGPPTSVSAAYTQIMTLALGSMGTLTAFLLSMLIRFNLGRWWGLRHGAIKDLWNSINTLCFDFAVYVPDNSPEVLGIKETILRYALASVELTFMEAQALDCWTAEEREAYRLDTWHDILQQGLLTKAEIQRLSKGTAAPQCLWTWIASLFTACAMEGRLPDPMGNMKQMLQHCAKARGAIRDILGQMETQNPLPFTHMMSLMVKLYLMLVIGLATFGGGMALYVGSPNDFICLVPAGVLCVALPVFYQGLLTVDAQMMNPFGNDEIDFPLRVYQNRMANECRAFYKCAAHAPTGFNQLPPQRLKWQVNSDFIQRSGGHAPAAAGFERDPAAPPEPTPPRQRRNIVAVNLDD